MVFRDLRVYVQANDAKGFHYRDNTGLEVDAVVEAGSGRWAAYEIKLGTGHIDAGKICCHGTTADFMSIWEAGSGPTIKPVWKIWQDTLCAP